MDDIFLYDPTTHEVELNVKSLILTKEYEVLIDRERNKCPEDPKGIRKLKANKEFKYIFLALSWSSIYKNLPNQEKHIQAMLDSGIDEKYFKENPDFVRACKKFDFIQKSKLDYRLVQSVKKAVEKVRIYFDNVDIMERDPETNKPIFKTKDLMAELNLVPELIKKVDDLENLIKKGVSVDTNVRGDARLGFKD